MPELVELISKYGSMRIASGDQDQQFTPGWNGSGEPGNGIPEDED
jgi:hypothetical protein